MLPTRTTIALLFLGLLLWLSGLITPLFSNHLPDG